MNWTFHYRWSPVNYTATSKGARGRGLLNVFTEPSDLVYFVSGNFVESQVNWTCCYRRSPVNYRHSNQRSWGPEGVSKYFFLPAKRFPVYVFKFSGNFVQEPGESNLLLPAVTGQLHGHIKTRRVGRGEGGGRFNTSYSYQPIDPAVISFIPGK